MCAGALTASWSRERRWAAATVLVVVGVAGRLLLLNYPNVETVLVACLMAGAFLGGWYTLLVPLLIVGISDPLVYLLGYRGFGLEAVLLLAAFTWTGWLFVSGIGRTARPKIVLRTKGVAVLTAVSVPLTIAWDLWAAFGEWITVTSRLGVTFEQMLAGQVSFTILHLISSLIFVPLFGTLFILAMRGELPFLAPFAARWRLPARRR